MKQELIQCALSHGRRFVRYGKPAGYIPELASKDPSKLGIAVYNMEGTLSTAGDCEEKFTMQSISKVIALILALEQNGFENVFSKVGMEPTGDAFNSTVRLDHLTNNKPFNPMINAGAIAVTSTMRGATLEERKEACLDCARRLTGDPALGVDYEVFLSEANTGYKNRAIIYLMRSNGIIEGNCEEHLELYFLLCSLACSCKDLAFFAATLATVLAQTLAAGLCAVYLRLRFPELMFRRADMVLDLPLLKRTAHFSFVTALHMCSLYIGKLLVQGTVNSLGEDAIIAFTAATRVEGFANSFGDSGSAAMAVFVGQNTGAGEDRRVRDGFFQGQKLLLSFGVFMSLVMILGAEPCLRLVLPAGNESGLGPAMDYLRLVACFYLFNFLGSGLAGYFRGRGRVNVPVIGATGHISLRVVLSFLLAPLVGLPAVALATGLGWIGVVAFWSVLVARDLRRLS